MHETRNKPGLSGRRARHLVRCIAVLALWTSTLRDATSAELPEGVRVGVQCEPRTATVGDHIRVRIEVTHPPAVRVEIPRPGGQLGDFTLIAFSPAAMQHAEDSPVKSDGVELVVAAYKTGVLELPGIPFKLVTADGRELSLATTPVTGIRIQSVLSGKNAELKDLKKQAEIDEPFPVLRWLVLLATAAGVAALAWWWVRRRRPARIVAAAQPQLNPLELAEAELRDLLGRGLPEKGFVKQFYVGLSDVLRKMLEGGYDIATAEKTTTEIMHALRDATPPQPDATRLARIEALLDACDLVKFAKYVPRREEIEAATRATFELLDYCRRRHAAAPDANPAAGAA